LSLWNPNAVTLRFHVEVSTRIADGTSLCLTAFSIGAIENPELQKAELKFIGFDERSLCFTQNLTGTDDDA